MNENGSENMTAGESKLKIVNQPINRIRFRYGTECDSHGVLKGRNSHGNSKSYPTVHLENYFGNENVHIKASLYTNTDPAKRHVHRLIGPNCKDGVCTLILDENKTAVFQNISIECIGKRRVKDVIYERNLKEMALDVEQIREISKEESKTMVSQLHVVRICFQAGIVEDEKPGKPWRLVSEVYSDPIINTKAPDSSELKIVKVNKNSGSCAGGDVIFLLCEKVNKSDIKIKFFQEIDGERVWEEEGCFTATDVHRQYAIVFRTPSYRSSDIGYPVEVKMELFRPSDGETSEPKLFIYEPLQQNKRKIPDIQTAKVSNTFNTIYEEDNRNNNFEGETAEISLTAGTCKTNETTKEETYVKSLHDAEETTLQEVEEDNDVRSILSNTNFQLNNENTRQELPNVLKENSADPFLGMIWDESADVCNVPTCSKYLSDDNDLSRYNEELLPDSIHNRILKINIKETSPEHNYSNSLHKECFQEELFLKFALRILKVRQSFLITRNIYHLFSVMHSIMKFSNNKGNNILHLAIINQTKYPELLNCLLKLIKTLPKICVNSVNSFDQTILHLAIENNEFSFIHKILEAGCNPNHRDKKGNTAVHYTVLYNESNCLKELIKFQSKYNVDLNVLNSEGLSPLHLAMKNGNLRQVEILCTGNINVNITDSVNGKTALHYAVQFCPEAIKVLLNHAKIIVHIKDSNGNTPFHLAHYHQSHLALSLLNKQNKMQLIKNVGFESSTFSADDENTTKFINKFRKNFNPKNNESACNKNAWIDYDFENRQIAFLENSVFEKICQLLDPPKEGWKILAEFIIDKKYIETLGKYESPTKNLLKLFKGNLQEFRTIIHLANLDEIMEILK
ncbi:nuclear factor NF-kappa-B p105 subunit-like [Centruroides sculpturatus]|uniref:nuclear factor NF-kappa-B p105 subunit-like n=1 Tax=Centruroides sculpturatus TaxID=218467 RepID=UPI000C6CB06E|nr:nuclear factor NF-kappa-B p105 subunit-like [Centruroides sculpturatus]